MSKSNADLVDRDRMARDGLSLGQRTVRLDREA